jgi:hypothetical protein
MADYSALIDWVVRYPNQTELGTYLPVYMHRCLSLCTGACLCVSVCTYVHATVCVRAGAGIHSDYGFAGACAYVQAWSSL